MFELGAVWLELLHSNERMEAVRNVLDIPEDLDAFCHYSVRLSESIHPQQDRFENNVSIMSYNTRRYEVLADFMPHFLKIPWQICR